jgi:hypothetical protein
MMSIANQPVEQYANLATTKALGPAEMQAQQALSGQSAFQGAQQQQDIQSRVDPMAFAQRQMRLKAATSRLGQLYGADPTAFNYRAPEAYAMPQLSSIPGGLGALAGRSGSIASNLATASVDRSGSNPALNLANQPKVPTYF